MKMKRNSRRSIVATAMALAVVAVLAVPALAHGSDVTRGDFATFATGSGLGYDIGGDAKMVRKANGTTKVKIHVTGLSRDETYVAHVHNQACADGEAGGHFKQDLTGASEPPNEIWPGGGPFSPNRAGIANQTATVDYSANSDAVSVVVHLKTDAGAPKIGCADLG